MKRRKEKRICAILIALALIMSCFAGCSASDTGYVTLSLAGINLTSYTVAGDISIELNSNAYADYSYSREKTEPIKLYASITGEVVQTDADTYLNIRANYGINDSKKPHQMSVILSDNLLYMPLADYIQAMDTGYQFEGISDGMRAKLKSGLEKEFGAYDYVILGDMTEFYSAPATMNSLVSPPLSPQASQKEVTALIVQSIMETFRNFDSGMTTAVPNGFTLEINPENVWAFNENLTKYLSVNKKAVYNGLVKLAATLETQYPYDATVMGLSNIMGEFLYDEQAFYDMIDEWVQETAELIEYEKELAKLTFKGSYLKDTVTKSGSTFAENAEFNLTMMGELVVSGKAQIKTTPDPAIKKVEIAPENPIDYEDLDLLAVRVERKVNHATEMTVTWGNDRYSYYDEWDDKTAQMEEWYGYALRRTANADIQLVEGEDWDYFEYINENGTLYLPLRDVCEYFGEDVEWDNAAKKAYVVRSGGRTEMTGKLEYTTTFVKIRDFEKLGYKIGYEYDKEWKEHTITIKK